MCIKFIILWTTMTFNVYNGYALIGDQTYNICGFILFLIWNSDKNFLFTSSTGPFFWQNLTPELSLLVRWSRHTVLEKYWNMWNYREIWLIYIKLFLHILTVFVFKTELFFYKFHVPKILLRIFYYNIRWQKDW